MSSTLPGHDWLPPSMIDLAKSRDLRGGEVLFRQGDPVSAIYEVETGRMRMVRHTVDDRVAVLHTAGRGQWIAEAALFSEHYHCDAIASAPTRVRSFPKRQMLQAILGDTRLAVGFMSSLAQQVHELRTRLEQRNIRSARERVTQFLMASADARSGSVPLRGTLMDLAEEVGLSHESLYRTLAALESDRLISRTKDKITLLQGRAV
jgi:CRP-like cAMP-binding protein